MENNKKSTSKIITIPNILSVVRIILIPIFMRLYIIEKNYEKASLVLILSGLTDALDGFIARNFNQISDFGKVLDPIADKLTQVLVLFSLVFTFDKMVYPLVLEIIKDLTIGILGLVLINKTRQVPQALWHGKLATILIYILMVSHVFWIDIPGLLSNILIVSASLAIVLSMVLYIYEAVTILQKT